MIKSVIKAFVKDESGLELSEYAMAAALVTLAVVGAFTALSSNISTVISNLATKIK
jgi:pilus assembly protein Flp/PilA